MDKNHRTPWLKSDTAKKKCPRSTNFFNLDHSLSEALLEWNDKVLGETSTFSIQDFVLKKDHSMTTMDDVEKGDPAGMEINISQNNREDEYYRMNGQPSTARDQGQQGYYSQSGQPPQQYQQYQQYPQYQQVEGVSTSDGDEENNKKKKSGKKSKFSGWESIKARNHFISKVFIIVLTLLLYNFGIMCLFIFVKPLTDFAREYWWMYIVFMVCFIPFAIALGCCQCAARRTPLNYILLFFAATFFGLALGCLSACYEIDEVLLAVGITILIVMILALIAIFSPCDFTICIGVAAVLVLVLFAFGIMMIFFYNRWLHIVYCSIGILVASLMIVIDIQMICGGKNRKIQFSEKDYAPAALTLYVDIAFLLMMVMGLTGAAR